jgi:hypothetical protein
MEAVISSPPSLLKLRQVISWLIVATKSTRLKAAASQGALTSPRRSNVSKGDLGRPGTMIR